MDIVFFSDFVETAPPRHKAAKKASPPPPQFPLPARPISEMNRNQVGSYAKQLVDFICLPNRKRGQGRCLPWEKQVSAGLISLKNRNMLKLTNNDVVSLAMIREWSSMGFSGGFKQGPGKSDQFWLKTISWSSFLLVIVEILMAVFEKGTVGEQSTSRSQETSSSSRPCSTSGASCPPSSFPLCPPQSRPARLPSSRPLALHLLASLALHHCLLFRLDVVLSQNVSVNGWSTTPTRHCPHFHLMFLIRHA